MENVPNALKDGSSTKMEFVLQSVISAILGLMTENANLAIKAMLLMTMENVLLILMHLCQALIACALNGNKELV